MFRTIALGFAAALALGASPALAQDSQPAEKPAKPAAAARHLVVLNKQGPNFSRAAEHPAELRAHRQIYLDLTAEGEIIASGLLRSEPPHGFVLFRQGVDEEAIKARLANDFVVAQGIVALEFIYWDIQMGAVGRPVA